MAENAWQLLDQIRDEAKKALSEDREPFVAEILSAYLKLRSDDSYAWYMYGEALRIVGRYKESYAALMQSARIAPRHKRPMIWIRLALIFESRGGRKRAEYWFEKAAKFASRNALDWFWVLRGANFVSWERYKEAEECYRKAIQINADNEEAHLNLGLLFRAMRRYPEALTELHACCAIDPEYALATEAIQSLEGIESASVLINELETALDP